jgi:hypothetical protein
MSNPNRKRRHDDINADADNPELKEVEKRLGYPPIKLERSEQRADPGSGSGSGSGSGARVAAGVAELEPDDDVAVVIPRSPAQYLARLVREQKERRVIVRSAQELKKEEEWKRIDGLENCELKGFAPLSPVPATFGTIQDDIGLVKGCLIWKMIPNPEALAQANLTADLKAKLKKAPSVKRSTRAWDFKDKNARSFCTAWLVACKIPSNRALLLLKDSRNGKIAGFSTHIGDKRASFTLKFKPSIALEFCYGKWKTTEVRDLADAFKIVMGKRLSKAYEGRGVEKPTPGVSCCLRQNI